MALRPDQESEIFQALGATSACWSHLEGAGVFKSTRAKDIGEELCKKIEGWIEEAKS